MKAITLHAPWGTLLHTRSVSHGIPDGMTPQRDFGRACEGPFVKRFETRSWPCPPSIIGQRIAIHQAKRKIDLGELTVLRDAAAAAETGTKFMSIPDRWWDAPMHRICPNGHVSTKVLKSETRGDLCLACMTKLVGVPPEWAVADLPLGCIVASGVITRSLKVLEVSEIGGGHTIVKMLDDRCKALGEFGATAFDMADQLPYGTFTPGRWAWELSDVAAATDRCPWCAGQGTLDLDAFGFERCAVCRGAGKCEPISATGKQRWWEWRP